MTNPIQWDEARTSKATLWVELEEPGFEPRWREATVDDLRAADFVPKLALEMVSDNAKHLGEQWLAANGYLEAVAKKLGVPVEMPDGSAPLGQRILWLIDAQCLAIENEYKAKLEAVEAELADKSTQVEDLKLIIERLDQKAQNGALVAKVATTVKLWTDIDGNAFGVGAMVECVVTDRGGEGRWIVTGASPDDGGLFDGKAPDNTLWCCRMDPARYRLVPSAVEPDDDVQAGGRGMSLVEMARRYPEQAVKGWKIALEVAQGVANDQRQAMGSLLGLPPETSFADCERAVERLYISRRIATESTLAERLDRDLKTLLGLHEERWLKGMIETVRDVAMGTVEPS